MNPDRCDLCLPVKKCIPFGRGRFELIGPSEIPRRNLIPISDCHILKDYEAEQLARYDWDIQVRLNGLYLGS